MLIASVEPEGTFVRNVSLLDQSQAEEVWNKMKDVPNFAGALGAEALKENEVVTIDSIGAGLLDDRHEGYARVHVTFWDKRLRGRELLSRRIVLWWMEKYSLGFIYSVVPLQSRTVIAFAKRVGFSELGTKDGHLFLIMYNPDFLHRANSPHTGD